MQETTSSAGSLSRRTFLKGTAAAAAIGATAGAGGLTQTLVPASAAAAEPNEERIAVSFCRCNCGDNGCTFKLHVRDGNIAMIEPQYLPGLDDQTPDHGRSRACLRGLSHGMRQYHPERILHPMRRIDDTERGAGQWEQITWEEAIDEIATKWKGYQREFGNASIARWTTWGNHALVQGETSVGWGRLNFFGGFSQFVTGADYAGIYTPAFHIGSGANGPTTSLFAEVTDNYVAWGINPAETYPHVWRYVAEMQEHGGKLIVVDPRVSATAAKADYHYPLRPATDTALCMGMIKYYMDNDLLPIAYLQAESDAILLVRQDTGMYLRAADASIEAPDPGTGPTARNDGNYVAWDNASGQAASARLASDPAVFGSYTVNGIACRTVMDLLRERCAEWTLEHTAEVTGLTEDQIVEFATLMLEGATTVHVGYGYGHYTNSYVAVSAVCDLVIASGNAGRPGGGFNINYNGGFTANDYYGTPENLHRIANADGTTSIEEGWNRRGPSYSCTKLPEIMETGKYNGKDAVIKSVYIHSANPLGNAPGRAAFMEGIEKVEFIVGVDFFMNDTMRYCDIVLPPAFWFECPDIYKPVQHPYFYYADAAVEPLGECKSDFEIASLLAEAMGFGDEFTESVDQVIQGMIDGANNMDADGNKITYERAKDEQMIRLVHETATGERHVPFTTPTSRLQFMIERPTPRLDWGEGLDIEKERLLYFEPPFEAWPETVGGYEANPLAEKYPLVFFSMHNRWRTHTTYYNVPWLRELDPEPMISINPIDAEARGIKEGDMVRAYNDRGFVVVRARIDAGMRPGSVNVPHGWQETQFVKGHYSDLSSTAADQFSGNENYYDCLCEVEKYKEA